METFKNIYDKSPSDIWSRFYTRQMNYPCHKNREKLIMQLKYNNNDVVEIKATNSS